MMDVDKVKYWTEIYDYDLETAEAMIQTKRWLYVGFMCHQTIEKIFKAYWCSKIEGTSPMSHNLINIAPELWAERRDVRGTEAVHQRDNATEHRVQVSFLQASHRRRIV